MPRGAAEGVPRHGYEVRVSSSFLRIESVWALPYTPTYLTVLYFTLTSFSFINKTQLTTTSNHPNPINHQQWYAPTQTPRPPILQRYLHLGTPPPKKDTPSTQAFLLALLTAGGGLTGYIRTGSVPSVAAGMTVGVLVRSSPYSSQPLPLPPFFKPPSILPYPTQP